MVGKKSERNIHPISSGPVASVWDLLREELAAVPQERPADSITPEEFAAKTGYTVSHARCLLRANPQLKPIKYRLRGNNAGTCYVAKGPTEAA